MQGSVSFYQNPSKKLHTQSLSKLIHFFTGSSFFCFHPKFMVPVKHNDDPCQENQIFFLSSMLRLQTFAMSMVKDLQRAKGSIQTCLFSLKLSWALFPVSIYILVLGLTFKRASLSFKKATKTHDLSSFNQVLECSSILLSLSLSPPRPRCAAQSFFPGSQTRDNSAWKLEHRRVLGLHLVSMEIWVLKLVPLLPEEGW